MGGTDASPPAAQHGFRLLPGYFSREQQAGLVSDVLCALQDAPLFTPPCRARASP